ncbi:MAG TPA: hypothetical protein PLB01_06265 [Thermoanaerobaculia bacterium]|nr:hypothetical protein [Thermoanaerobaculia bacterium]
MQALASLACLVLLAVQPASPTTPKLTLVSPKGGESWVLGTTQNIVWTASGVTGEVRISLQQEGWNLGRGLIAKVPAGTGSFAWTVGKLMPGYTSLTEKGTGFRIRIEALNPTVIGESPQPFGIAEMPTARPNVALAPGALAPKTITVTSPAAGATWQRTQTYDITWQQSENLLKEFARILLLRSTGEISLTIETKRPLQSGRHSWQLPGVNDVPALTEGDYRVRIETVNGEAKGDSGLFHVARTVKFSNPILPATTKNGSHWFASTGKQESSTWGPVEPGAGTVKVGFINDYNKPKQVSVTYRSHIFVDLKGVKGKVKWAKLSYEKNDGTPDGARPLWVITQPWNGTSMDMWNHPGNAVNLSDAGQMKAIVQGWIDDPTMNFGFLMAGPDESMARAAKTGHVMILSNVRLDVGIDAVY